MNVTEEPFSVEGNQCRKGAEFAVRELKKPKRILTTVAKVAESEEAAKDKNTVNEIVSVKTAGPIRKDKIPLAMKAARKLVITPPVEMGMRVKSGKFEFIVTGKRSGLLK